LLVKGRSTIVGDVEVGAGFEPQIVRLAGVQVGWVVILVAVAGGG
jgi:hypothetical protein